MVVRRQVGGRGADRWQGSRSTDQLPARVFSEQVGFRCLCIAGSELEGAGLHPTLCQLPALGSISDAIAISTQDGYKPYIRA